MKITKKRVAITAAALALVTAGIFGGTYAKYKTETLPTTDQARLAKFYLESDNTFSLFKTEYDNDSEKDDKDVKNDGSDNLKMIAPNVTTTENLSFTVNTEVKSELVFTGFEIVTNLPAELKEKIYIKVGNDASNTHTLADMEGGASISGVHVANIAAGTAGGSYQVPVEFTWNLESSIDDEETAAAIKQYEEILLNGQLYDLQISGNATLTQID